MIEDQAASIRRTPLHMRVRFSTSSPGKLAGPFFDELAGNDQSPFVWGSVSRAEQNQATRKLLGVRLVRSSLELVY